MRIVSLVPSFTKTLFDFGLDESQIVGRTKFCIHPLDLVRNVPIVGGTKNINLDKIRSLQPDLILASKEENLKEPIEILMKEFRVYLTDIKKFDESQSFLLELGQLLGKNQIANEILHKINRALHAPKNLVLKPVTYLIWKDPYLTVGGDTFINSILKKLGFESSYTNYDRYPEISLKELSESQTVFLSSEPYPFKEAHKQELLEQFPHLEIHLVDGEAFSWYGSHLKEFTSYYEKIRKITSA